MLTFGRFQGETEIKCEKMRSNENRKRNKNAEKEEKDLFFFGNLGKRENQNEMEMVRKRDVALKIVEKVQENEKSARLDHSSIGCKSNI